jgi:O-antigen ligase
MTTCLTLIARWALFGLLIFTPLARGSVQGWAVTVIEMVTLVGLTALLFQKILDWDWKWIKTPLDKPIILLFMLAILSTVFSMHKTTSIWASIQLLNYIVIFYLVIHTIRTRSQLRQLVYVIIGVAVFLSVFGLFKRFGVNPFPWWDYSELKYSPDWLSATYANHNHMAGYLEMAIPLALALLLTGLRPGTLFLLVYLSFLLLTTLVLTLSRGGWIGCLAGLSFMAIALLTSPRFERKRLLGAIAVGALVVALVALVSTPVVERVLTIAEEDQAASLSSRVIVWNGIYKMIPERPFLGTGPGTFATVFTQYQPPGLNARFFMADNDYLQFISEVGLPLIAIIIWMIIALYRKGFKKLKNPSRLSRWMTLGAMAGLTAILVHSISDFNLHIPANAILFVVLAAIVVAPLPVSSDHDKTRPKR